MNALSLSWKNLTHKPLTLLLSLVLFSLGVAMISFLLLLNNQLEEKFDKNLAGIDLVIGAKGSPLQLILCSMYHIDAPTGNIGIDEVKAFLNPDHPLIEKAIPLSLGDSYKGYRIVGTETSFLDLYEAKIVSGKIWDQNYGVVIGSDIVDILELNIGDEFNSSHGFVLDDNLIHDDAHKFKVVGILNRTGSVIDQLIMCHPKAIWDVHNHSGHVDTEEAEHEHHAHDHGDHAGHDHGPPPFILSDFPDKEITSLLVTFKTRSFQTLNMQRSINENTDLQAANPAIEINRLYLMVGAGAELLKTIAIIIFIISALSIFISLYNSLRERKYEIALLRVVGSSRSKLFWLVILEGLIIAVLGYLIGIAISHLGMAVLADTLRESYRYSFTGLRFLKEELWLLPLALLIGVVAAVIPAYRASRQDISRTLTMS